MPKAHKFACKIASAATHIDDIGDFSVQYFVNESSRNWASFVQPPRNVNPQSVKKVARANFDEMRSALCVIRVELIVFGYLLDRWRW